MDTTLLTFPIGGVIAYLAGQGMELHVLVALGAGKFIYIAGADLIPEVKRAERLRHAATRFGFFAAGVALLYAAHAMHPN